MSDTTEAPGSQQAAAKLKVFISYSRVDGVFAEMVRDALVARGYEARLDKTEITAAEDWRARLDSLILGVEAVVFIISQDSVARWDAPPPHESVCAWEIRRTIEHNKRLIPVDFRRAASMTVPPELSLRHYVDAHALGAGYGDVATTYKALRDAREQGEPEAVLAPMKERHTQAAAQYRELAAAADALPALIRQLDTALNVGTVLWERELTSWHVRAEAWKATSPDQQAGKLLPIGELADVQAWSRLRPTSAPTVPAVVTTFIQKSAEKIEQDDIKQRRIIGRAFVKPSQQALEDGLSDHALRLAAAGVLLVKDLDFDPKIDTQLCGPILRAIHESRARAVLHGHSHKVTVSAFNPDGQRIVTASCDNTARIWDGRTGQQIALLRGHTNDVNSASFSPDGQRIVTASDDKMARIWGASSGQQIALLQGHTKDVTAASFSPDGQRIATTSWDETARIWDAANGQQIALLQGHTGLVTAASFSPNGQRIVTASWDKTAQISDAAIGQQIALLQGHTGSVTAASFSPDGLRIVTASDDKTVRIWDVSRTERVTRGHAVVLAAALARGLGRRTATEAADLLMQDAPEDLYAAALIQLGRTEDDSEIAAVASVMNAPLHPNCYLSPTQFAEKFGLAKPVALAKVHEVDSPNAPPIMGIAAEPPPAKIAVSDMDDLAVKGPASSVPIVANASAGPTAAAPPLPGPRRKVPHSHQRVVFASHAKSSPHIAAWLDTPEVICHLDTFDAADAQAARRQKRYLRTARRAAILSTLATIIAALTLLPIDQAIGLKQPRWIGLLQFLCVVVAFWSVMRISWSKLLYRWMRARAETEGLRAELFRDLMRAPLPPAAQFAAFEACHLDYQRSFYEKRGGQLAKAAGGVAPLKLVGYAMLALSAAVSAVLAADIALQYAIAWSIQPWPWVLTLASAAPLEATRWQLGLGALASGALSFASAWTLINQDDRNALRYAATLGKLDVATAESREDARKAAARGDRTTLLAFTDRVQTILDSEHSAWVAARPPGNPTAGPGPSLEKAV